MFKFVKPMLAGSVTFSAIIFLSACGSGSSSNPNPAPTPPPTVITAHANIPSPVDSNSTFTASVWLTSSSQTSSSHAVAILDTGTAGSTINCPGSKTLTPGGPSATFSCQAPQVTLGGDNTHLLQIQVDGKDNLSTPAKVDVVNDGSVTAELQNVSGAHITAAAPAQTVEVAFSTASSPAGTGKYTVTAPSGWQVANGGVCSLPNGGSNNCKVAVTVPNGAPNGNVTIGITSESGSSALDTNKLPLSVQAQPPTNNLTLEYKENITNTLYANLPGQSVKFTYKPKFTFKNTSGSSLNVTGATVEGLTNLSYTCNGASGNACTLPAGGLYVVEGDLNNTFSSLALPPAPSSLPAAATASVSVAVQGNGVTLAQQDQPVTFVKYKPGYVAMRVVDNQAPRANLVAFYASTMAVFKEDSDRYWIGKMAATQGLNMVGDQFSIPDGGVAYLPYGASGKIYIVPSNKPFTTKAAPSTVGSPTPPPYVVDEFTYDQTYGCTAPATCEAIWFDESYVNSVGALADLSTIGHVGQAAASTRGATYGVKTDKSLKQVFSAVETYFDGEGAPWAYSTSATNPCLPDTTLSQNYIQKDSDGDEVIRVISPNKIGPVAGCDPMPSGYYDNYVNALWTWLESNPIYVDDINTGISNYQQTQTDAGCTLEGQVMTSGTNAGKLVFHAVPPGTSTCPAKGYAIGPASYQGAFCGPNKDQPCADTPDLVFGKFNDCDFNEGAGSADCHNPDIVPSTFFGNGGLWGPNGTYRAVVGRAIAAYQAIGLLPDCSNPTLPLDKGNAGSYVQGLLASNPNAHFSNPPCLTGLTKPTYNVYTSAFLPYLNVYTYTYGDFLGLDHTFGYYYSQLDPTLAQELPRAQPVTVTLQ